MYLLALQQRLKAVAVVVEGNNSGEVRVVFEVRVQNAHDVGCFAIAELAGFLTLAYAIAREQTLDVSAINVLMVKPKGCQMRDVYVVWVSNLHWFVELLHVAEQSYSGLFTRSDDGWNGVKVELLSRARGAADTVVTRNFVLWAGVRKRRRRGHC